MSAFNDEAELVAWLDRLPGVRVGTNYSRTDRAKDFLATFNSPHGQRVFAQITALLSPNPAPSNAEKPGILAFNEGLRYGLARIMHCMVAPEEPQQKGDVDVAALAKD